MLVIASKQGKARIEVGYGLEGSLPDVVAFRVIHNIMAPHLKTGHFDEGVEEGVAAIVSQLESKAPDSARSAQVQPSVTVSGSPRDAQAQDGGSAPGPILTFFGWFFAILVAIVTFGVLVVYMLPGSPFGWIAYPFMGGFVFFGAVAATGSMQAAKVILWIYLIAYPVGKLLLPRTAWYQRKYANVTHSGAGGSSASRSSDSDSSGGGSPGSGSSGDDFSGEGGRSGGGGSSDDFGSDDRRDDSSDDDR
jgi:uncharacterized protein